ncbi:ZZ-type zinc finger-containing protein 3 [Anguilla anguilla]|uniref:ZZ-type zinc finger-containing protein 3 n=1 Tax=Anguilla anguilla TaxID=7936 RepID=UPI0015B02F00|nr:ZZ-type zinc finger-containing protein 3 [Anguilla anguilla]XP_035279415.1 ZZ-type zinc finger-containing protein 3 [Anguilla anguilla]
MAAPRSTRVTRSSVGINGLDENFCGRTLRNRSIAQPEESQAAPLPRARSPKKRQECPPNQQLQPPQKGPLSGRQGPEEQWLSPRKRVLSCSERDCPEGGGGRGPAEASHVQKRAKRCSRSGDAPGSEEDSPGKAERPARDPTEGERAPGESDEDTPAPRPDRLRPPPDERDREENAGGAAEGDDPPASADEPRKVANGLDGRRSADAGACPESSEPSPGDARVSSDECQRNSTLALPNGGQADSATPSDPHVPCKNSNPERAEPDGPVMAEEPPTPCPAPSGAPPPAREPEEEVDVVGDAGCRPQERAPESANGGPGAARGGSHISGEARPPDPAPEPEAAPDPAPDPSPTLADAPSFTEPQEHRYTLRTSPRRPACSKPPSPSVGNGPHKEDDGRAGPAEEEASPKTDGPPSSGRGPASGQGTECSGEAADTAGGEAGVSEASVPKSTKEPAGSQAAEEDEDEEDPDVYYFESDHLALKHNKDYQRLLQTISVLEAQRTQAVLDLESLARHQREALRDPISFVEKLQKQVGMGLPCPQRVVQLPDIAWDQYTSGLGDFEREFRDKKRNTRRLKLIFDKVGLPARPKSPLDSRKEGEPSALYSALPSSDAPEHSASSSRTQMIRGRVCDQNKPDTFNQLWTVEEQKRLEQLLLKFPPEEVESKRWQKIADELGNRTAKQVASRVQKYFIKLTKAGIPVPGRTPNLCMYSKKASSKRQHHLNKHLYRPSTFLTSYEPPVYMDDEDDRSSFYSGLQDPTAEDSDEDGIPVEYRGLPEYKELLELKKLKKQKIHEIRAENALAQHMGYKCDGCGTEPIQGVRWHCRDCPPDLAVDFCSNCSDCLYKTEAHKPSHQLEPVFQPESFLDRDYCLPQSAGYNYLDPNYFPANR